MKKINNTHGLLLALLFSSMQAAQSPQELLGVIVEPQCTSEIRIKEHQRAIAFSIGRNNCWRVSCKVAGVLGGLGACYMLYNRLSLFTPDPTKELKHACKELKRANSQIAYCKEAFSLLKKMHPGSSFETFLNDDIEVGTIASTKKSFLGRMFDGMTSFPTLCGIATLAVKQIFYDQGLLPFIRDNTALSQVYADVHAIHENIEVLRTRTYISDYRADHYLRSMVSNFNALLSEMERVIGYMNYRTEQLNLTVSSSNGDALLSMFLVSCLDETAQKLRAYKKSYTDLTSEQERIAHIIFMYEALEQCKKEVESSIYAFARCEKQLA